MKEQQGGGVADYAEAAASLARLAECSSVSALILADRPESVVHSAREKLLDALLSGELLTNLTPLTLQQYLKAAADSVPSS